MAFDTLKLDKGLYTSNKGFTGALEQIDPSENYKGTELDGLDAYERQLKRFDIKVSGNTSDTISKFFATTDSAVLFPEYVSRAVKLGLDENSFLDDIVATTTIIDSLDYRSIESINDDVAGGDDAINEGTFIPETVVKTKNSLTKLNKHGRSLVASYEALKTQKLDLFTITLKQIGRYIANCQLINALGILTTNGKELSVVSSTNLNYEDFINLWSEIQPYEMNTILAEAPEVKKILGISEFKDAKAGQDFHGTGKLVTPLGAKLHIANSHLMQNMVVAFDKNFALEKVQLGGIVTDFDKLIDRQLERATVTCTSGFNSIFDDACAYLIL